MRRLAIPILVLSVVVAACPNSEDVGGTSPAGDPVEGQPTAEEEGPDGDLDGDGLTNAEEAEAGTDELDADTDGDGYLDGDEVEHGSDPNDQFSHPDNTPSGIGGEMDGEVVAGATFTFEIQADGTIVIDGDFINGAIESPVDVGGIVVPSFTSAGGSVTAGPSIDGVEEVTITVPDGDEFAGEAGDEGLTFFFSSPTDGPGEMTVVADGSTTTVPIVFVDFDALLDMFHGVQDGSDFRDGHLLVVECEGETLDTCTPAG